MTYLFTKSSRIWTRALIGLHVCFEGSFLLRRSHHGPALLHDATRIVEAVMNRLFPLHALACLARNLRIQSGRHVATIPSKPAHGYACRFLSSGSTPSGKQTKPSAKTERNTSQGKKPAGASAIYLHAMYMRPKTNPFGKTEKKERREKKLAGASEICLVSR
jgi:hypothetical protein